MAVSSLPTLACLLLLTTCTVAIPNISGWNPGQGAITLAGLKEKSMTKAAESDCSLQVIEDFFACNCWFVKRTGIPILENDPGLTPEELQGAVEACALQFGGFGNLKLACMRIAGSYPKCRLRKARRAGKVIAEECFDD